MRVFPPSNSSYVTAVTRSGPPLLVREPQLHLSVEEINRLRLAIKLAILAVQTRRLLRLVIKLVILAERARRCGCRFEGRLMERSAAHG